MSNAYGPIGAVIRNTDVRLNRELQYDTARAQALGGMVNQLVVCVDDLAEITGDVKLSCCVNDISHTVQGEFQDYGPGPEPAFTPLMTQLTVEYSSPADSLSLLDKYRISLGYGSTEHGVIFRNEYVIRRFIDSRINLRARLAMGGLLETANQQNPLLRRRVRMGPASEFDTQYVLDELQRLQLLNTAMGGR